MALIVLLPAVAVLAAIGALTYSLSRVEREAAALRVSLRRIGAAAVATDELDRASQLLAAKAVAVQADARLRVRRPRRSHRPRSTPVTR